jgi:uncharacterized membrane protein
METISPSQARQRWYRRLAIVAIVLNLAVTVGFKVYSGGFQEWLLTPWSLLPLLVLYAAAVVAAGHRASLVVLIGSLACLGLTTFVYANGFILNPDPQSGLLFLIVPYYQLLGSGILFGIAGVDRLRHMDRMEESGDSQ